MAETQPQADNVIRLLDAHEVEGKRVRAIVDLTEKPGQPNVELILLDAGEKELCRALILSANTSHIEFTLHIRGAEPLRPMRLKCVTTSDEAAPLDEKSIEVGGISQPA